jgi:hypothetical protein
VSYACAVFEHLRIADPMVAYLASGPMASYELGEVFGVTPRTSIFAGVIVSQLGFDFVFGCIGAFDHDERACAG